MAAVPLNLLHSYAAHWRKWAGGMGTVALVAMGWVVASRVSRSRAIDRDAR
jgi:hypothetical protein